jgi:hypothetical protein
LPVASILPAHRRDSLPVQRQVGGVTHRYIALDQQIQGGEMIQAKTLASLFVTGVAATLITVAPATAAHADNGDETPNCVRGEICFYWNNEERYQKHFYWYGNHSGNYFMDYVAGNNVISNIPLQDHAWYVKNRDTGCTIRVGALDINGRWQWDYIPNDGVKRWLTNTADRNDRHECG